MKLVTGIMSTTKKIIGGDDYFKVEIEDGTTVVVPIFVMECTGSIDNFREEAHRLTDSMIDSLVKANG